MTEKEFKDKIAEYEGKLEKLKKAQSNPQLTADMKSMLSEKAAKLEGMISDLKAKGGKSEEKTASEPKPKSEEKKPKSEPKPKAEPTPEPKSDAWVAYKSFSDGKEKVEDFENAKKAKSWLKKNEDKILGEDDVEGVGVMNKSSWDKEIGKRKSTPKSDPKPSKKGFIQMNDLVKGQVYINPNTGTSFTFAGIDRSGEASKDPIVFDTNGAYHIATEFKKQQPKAEPKKPASKKKSSKSKTAIGKKLPRHVFEYDVENGIQRYIILAKTKEEAIEKNTDKGSWKKVVTKGRSPLVGFIENVVKGEIGRPRTRVITKNFLFEKDSEKTVTRKIISTETKEEALKEATEGFEFIKELKGSGRLPKEGTFKKVLNRKKKTVLKEVSSSESKSKKANSNEISIGGKIYKIGSKEACEALLESYKKRKESAAKASKANAASNTKSKNVRKASSVGSLIKKLIKIDFSASKKNAENYDKMIAGLTKNKATIIKKATELLKSISIMADYNPVVSQREVKKAVNDVISELKEKKSSKAKTTPNVKKKKFEEGGETTAQSEYVIIGGDIDSSGTNGTALYGVQPSYDEAMEVYDTLTPDEKQDAQFFSIDGKGNVTFYQKQKMFCKGGEA